MRASRIARMRSEPSSPRYSDASVIDTNDSSGRGSSRAPSAVASSERCSRCSSTKSGPIAIQPTSARWPITENGITW